MEPSDINEKANELSHKLNTKRDGNKIKRCINKVRETSPTSVDPENSRKESTLTNHELGNTTAPLETNLDDKYTEIDPSTIRELDQELKSLKKEFEQFVSEVSNVDIDELSKTATQCKNRIATIEDHFSYSIFTHHDEPIYSQYLDRRTRKPRVDRNQYEDFIESLDRVVEECHRASKDLRDVKFPDLETMKEEAERTRRERAKREMEEMRPYMAVEQIKRHFDIEEVFTPKELAESVDSWDESTAEMTIEDAMEADIPNNKTHIEQVNEDKYKLV